MTIQTKLLLLLLAGVPALLGLPLVTTLGAMLVGDVVFGNEFPLGEAFLGACGGFAIMVALLIVTLIAYKTGSFRWLGATVAGMVVFDALAIPGTMLVTNWVVPRPYDRGSLRLDPTIPAAVDVTGVWEGTWTDPRQGFTEKIRLTLLQSRDGVAGSIIDGRGTKWRIIEGAVSGSEVNLFYDRDFPAWPGRGATLIGTVHGDGVAGNYFGHERARAGGSTSGSWQAERASAGD
jgi:hypothetical protein